MRNRPIGDRKSDRERTVYRRGITWRKVIPAQGDLGLRGKGERKRKSNDGSKPIGNHRQRLSFVAAA
jgi:hypothetical protein